MTLKNDDLLHEFYAKEGHKYPDLNLEQFKEIVFNPWVFTKKQMESGELNTVRLKYFGTFQVYEGRAKRMLVNLKQRHKFNKIDPKQFFKLKDMLEKFLKKNGTN
jgi:nucleoid DNA-binding protein